MGTDDENDNTLLEYILLLVSNHRPKTHIASDLEVHTVVSQFHVLTTLQYTNCHITPITPQAFFGKEASLQFTDWLWNLLLPYQEAAAEAVPEDTEQVSNQPLAGVANSK